MATVSAQQLQTGHVGLNVSDLGRSKKFYEEVLGFRSWVNHNKKTVDTPSWATDKSWF